MNGKPGSQAKHTKHTGVHRGIENKINTADKIALGRRTAYSLMGAGLHGGSGQVSAGR